MRADHFKRLFDGLDSLTPEQMRRVHHVLTERLRRVNSVEAVEQAKPTSWCLHCGGEDVVRNGSNRGLQRYLCRACKRSFNVATGTPLSRLRNKGLFLQQAECLAKGLTIRQAAEALGVSVSTAFRWRHRFLQEVVAHQPRAVAGLLEADETYLRESRKGSRRLGRPARHRGYKPTSRNKGKKMGWSSDLVPVLIGRLRGQPHITDRVLTRMDGEQALAALKGVLGKDTLLCTDGSSAFLKIQKELGVPVKSVATRWHGPVLDNVYHVQSVNSYHERLKSWVQRDLRGVATKYLPNYLAWMRVSEWFKNSLQPEHFITSALGRQVINA
jgi:transposase-like protein